MEVEIRFLRQFAFSLLAIAGIPVMAVVAGAWSMRLIGSTTPVLFVLLVWIGAAAVLIGAGTRPASTRPPTDRTLRRRARQ